MNTNGAIQRAELFANVDELMAWKKSFELKQIELIQWQTMVMQQIAELKKELETTLKGCHVLVECDSLINGRIDIYNKRLRVLETKVKKIGNMARPDFKVN